MKLLALTETDFVLQKYLVSAIWSLQQMDAINHRPSTTLHLETSYFPFSPYATHSSSPIQNDKTNKFNYILVINEFSTTYAIDDKYKSFLLSLFLINYSLILK